MAYNGHHSIYPEGEVNPCDKTLEINLGSKSTITAVEKKTMTKQTRPRFTKFLQGKKPLK